VSDLEVSGSIAAISISAAELAKAGDALEAIVSIKMRKMIVPASFSVCARLSTHGRGEVVPFPERVNELALAGTLTNVHFTFHLPRTLLPHGYAIKVLAMSPQEMAFASRPLFVESLGPSVKRA
jgi:hypothetical protein